MNAYPDVPVACVESGLILVLERVLPEKDYELAIEKLHRLGVKTTFVGRICSGCVLTKTISGTPTCEYRPLRGPLFVPR